MEPIFTVPYLEYVVANQLAKAFKKNDGYSIFVPTSRQQKGIDLLLVKQKLGGLCASVYRLKHLGFGCLKNLQEKKLPWESILNVKCGSRGLI